MKDLFNDATGANEEFQRDDYPRYATQCGGTRVGQGYPHHHCGAGDIARITKPATLYVRSSDKGPEVVAEDLFTVPEGLIRQRRKRKGSKQDTLHVMPSERKKKAPTVLKIIKSINCSSIFQTRGNKLEM